MQSFEKIDVEKSSVEIRNTLLSIYKLRYTKKLTPDEVQALEFNASVMKRVASDEFVSQLRDFVKVTIPPYEFNQSLITVNCELNLPFIKGLKFTHLENKYNELSDSYDLIQRKYIENLNAKNKLLDKSRWELLIAFFKGRY